MFFFVEKFAEKIEAKTFHCFADFNIHNISNVNVLNTTSLKHSWPEWSKLKNVLSNDFLNKEDIVIVSIDKDLYSKLKNANK